MTCANKDSNQEDAPDFEFHDNEMNDESLPRLAEKKKRTPSNHVAKIALSDLIKYFDKPIILLKHQDKKKMERIWYSPLAS
ncbi:unnamed protein product [Lupinus luteus]|uniref:Uncharacterized protein n=1 Tax=Lupinus luteus TaxID=3873 RepID=A0AAV1WD23_LUPLU